MSALNVISRKSALTIYWLGSRDLSLTGYWSVLLFIYPVAPASNPQRTSPFRILLISNRLWIGFATSGRICISFLFFCVG